MASLAVVLQEVESKPPRTKKRKRQRTGFEFAKGLCVVFVALSELCYLDPKPARQVCDGSPTVKLPFHRCRDVWSDVCGSRDVSHRHADGMFGV